MRLMFVGDINLGEYYTAFGHGPRTYLDNGDIFSSVGNVLAEADLVAGNLEAPLTDHSFKPYNVESSVLRGNPKHVDYLVSNGFRILQVANNHTVQHGPQGFEETVKTLLSSGIQPIGINEQELLIMSIDSQTIGFLAASDVPDNTDKNQSSYQRLTDDFINKVKESVNFVDHLFVMLHWGLESSTNTMDYQKKIISSLTGSGVRGIIGSHPHLFYELWLQGNSIVAPSLGNFVFDLFWDKRLLQSGILDIEIEKGCISCQVWPIQICEYGQPVVSGAPIEVKDSLKLYELGENMQGEQKRKLLRFFKDFSKGNSLLKGQFILKKLLGKI